MIYQGRTEGMNQWKSAHAVNTSARTLADAMKGADVFYGLSAKGAVTKEMVASMAAKPIIFAMANPDPEITAEEVAEVRDDAIMATGRSDYPNQVNNVLGFPYIFRGALDVRATTINMEMKIAAARALAELAREDVPDEVAAAYGTRPKFGPDYIIPVPFDPRLISHVPPAVAKAAMDTGVARKPIEDMDAYRQSLRTRRDPIAGVLQQVFQRLRRAPKRVVFAEGEEEQVIRAAASFVQERLGTALLVGREEPIRQSAKNLGIELGHGIEIINAALSTRNANYVAYLYERLQRQGYLIRDVQRLINQDRNHFAACMLALGDADAMVTGVTRNYSVALEDVRRVIDPKPGHRVIGLSMILSRGRIVLVAALDELEREVDRCYGGEPEWPVMRQLQPTIRAYDLPREPFARLIEANRMDQRVSAYATWSDLKHYCVHSADPVGRLVLGLLRRAGDPVCVEASDSVCTGLQLVNFLQDVPRDLALGRIYLPAEDRRASRSSRSTGRTTAAGAARVRGRAGGVAPLRGRDAARAARRADRARRRALRPRRARRARGAGRARYDVFTGRPKPSRARLAREAVAVLVR